MVLTIGRDEYSVPVRGTILSRTAGADGPWRQTDTSIDGGSLVTPRGGSPLRREVVDAILDALRGRA